MINLSTVVMTHPSRRAGAARVAAAYGSGSTIVLDPEPDAAPSTLRTSRAAWAAADPDATHHLVLQDDIELVPGFADHVRQAVAHLPQAGLAFFTEWGSRTADMLRVAAITGMTWTECVDRYIPTQAVVLPTALARSFAIYAADLPPDTPDDNALMAHLRSHDVPALVKVSNLVEHLDLPSTVGNHWMGQRRAACYLPTPPEDPGQPGTILPAARIVPHLAWEDATAVYWTIETDVTRDWTHQPLPPLLREHGLTDPVRATIWHAAAEHQPDELVHNGHTRLLEQLAEVATALGMAAQHWSPALLQPTELPPAARQALTTMAPGGLRLHLDPDLLTRNSQALTAFVTTAAHTAASACKAGVLTPLNCWDDDALCYSRDSSTG
jgi:hypothetical protein